jgi:hypothetical protein
MIRADRGSRSAADAIDIIRSVRDGPGGSDMALALALWFAAAVTEVGVERHFGHAIAHAYAGHIDHHDDTASLYICAQLPELATALAAYTGEPHPLAEARPTTRPAELRRARP